MQTATVPFDYDALVKPIEQARDTAEARSAVWAVLRGLGHIETIPVTRDAMAAIDAAAWSAGCSERFRKHAILTTVMMMSLDELNDVCRNCCHTTQGESVACFKRQIESLFPVAPDRVRDLV